MTDNPKQTEDTKTIETTEITEPTENLGNIEIIIENISQEQLDQLLDFIIEKVEAMGLIMVARAYLGNKHNNKKINETEDTEETQNAEETGSTEEG